MPRLAEGWVKMTWLKVVVLSSSVRLISSFCRLMPEVPKWADHLRSGVRDQPGQHGKTLSLLKIYHKNISQARCQAPVIPATWEAEAGKLLEPGRQKIQ